MSLDRSFRATARLLIWRYAPILVMLMLAPLGFGLVSGCSAPEESSPQAAASQLPEQQIYDYELIESQEGVRRWRLESARMERYANRDDVELYEVRMQFFRQGEYFSTLTSQRGRANLTAKNLFAFGDVVVVTEDGRRLETEELHYDNGRELIYNDVYNRFTWGEDLVTGNGLEATPDLEYLEIKERVSAEVEDRSKSEGQNP
jgi:LPS export ABC transporter protein LptC